MKAADKAHADSNLQTALLMIAFGTVMLGLCYVLAQDEIPLLRQGRFLLGLIGGGGSLGYGLWRLAVGPQKFDYGVNR